MMMPDVFLHDLIVYCLLMAALLVVCVIAYLAGDLIREAAIESARLIAEAR